jgi:hypothetical protein
MAGRRIMAPRLAMIGQVVGNTFQAYGARGVTISESPQPILLA